MPQDTSGSLPRVPGAGSQEEGLKDENELQSYLKRRVDKYMLGKGRHIIGWDEILEGGVAKTAVVQSWRGMEGAVAAAAQGNRRHLLALGRDVLLLSPGPGGECGSISRR